MFHKFKNRVKLSATLKAETGLYVGAGQESFSPLAVQGSVMKNANGHPYIPGSSLKGVLRSFLESVQNNVYNEKSAQDCVSCNRELDDKEARKAKGDPEDVAVYIEQNSCPACRLFGSGIMAGKLKFADATLKTPEAWLGTEVRTGNAIDRDTHTVIDRALFDTEVIPSGTEFLFRVSAENLTGKEATIFSELMLHFAEGGISVGGRSRAGLGVVSVKDIMTALFYMDKENKKSYIPKKEEWVGIEGLVQRLSDEGVAYVQESKQ